MTSKLTRERLQEIAEDGFLKHGESKELARMALAAMDSEPVVQPVMFIDGDISSDDADKLAKIIRGFNEEDERPLAKMARIIRENPHPTNECDMPKAQPAPVVHGEIASAIEELKRTLVDCNRYNYCSDAVARVEGACRAAMLQAGTLIGEGTKLPPLKCLEIVKFNADCAISDPESIYASEFFLSLDEVFGEKGNYKEPVQAKAVSMLIGEVLRLHNYQADTLTNEGETILHNYRTAMEGIGHIRRTLEETFGGLHGTHVEPDVLIECKTICDAIYAAYRGSAQGVPDEIECVATTLEHIGNFAGAAIIRQLVANQQQNAPQNIPEIIPQWIPVSERMPEDRISVILWDAEIGEVTSGHYSHKTQTFYHCGDAIENEITHWMPPPCAPQEVNRE
ncbi:DUF551 domain-containing protein [Klebsiella oxytoca]|uniref:DUF551 domain-containing protein n=1 Tax=Klebsiella grimontii TaxID=2058152 RepID=UPI0015EAA2EC|nr:DUF551 domain-containing protein [Klebsiella grimontii]EGT0063711.1 DUF551 domain-containing protein [Klebsiella michiganensis]QLU24542.1 DUF551 domain-containing protein [Klebsiella oxytoca]WDI72473.1 DUF551 domain-containing protein [Klebsiella grimontii]